MEARARYLKDGSLVYQLKATTEFEKSLNESVEFLQPRLFVSDGNLHLEFLTLPKESG